MFGVRLITFHLATRKKNGGKRAPKFHLSNTTLPMSKASNGGVRWINFVCDADDIRE